MKLGSMSRPLGRYLAGRQYALAGTFRVSNHMQDQAETE